jgi:TPP-dependent pyruvate/acetoin dehydrogenase alpha subunit
MTRVEFDVRRGREECMPDEINLENLGLTKEKALDLLRQMWKIRVFE